VRDFLFIYRSGREERRRVSSPPPSTWLVRDPPKAEYSLVEPAPLDVSKETVRTFRLNARAGFLWYEEV
jgi:hypothetical protein